MPCHLFRPSAFPLFPSALDSRNLTTWALLSFSGNEQLNLDLLSSLGYSYNPCLVNLSNVVCVGASDERDALANFTNSGRKTVHIAAPGRAIASTMISE